MNETKYYSLADAARLAGVPYGRVWYYLATKRLPEPERLGRTRVLTHEEVEAIRQFFGDGQVGHDEAIHT